MLIYPTLQIEGLCVCSESHRCEGVGVFSVVHEGQQQAVMVDLNLGLLQGRRHSFLHLWVAEAGDAGLGKREDDMDTITQNPEAEQSLNGGENVDAVSVDDGVIWRDTCDIYQRTTDPFI